jgi:hypothetical protein
MEWHPAFGYGILLSTIVLFIRPVVLEVYLEFGIWLLGFEHASPSKNHPKEGSGKTPFEGASLGLFRGG